MRSCSLKIRVSRPDRNRRSAFTLPEVIVATFIIGIVFIAIVDLVAAGYKIGVYSSNRSKAVMLAQEIREWTMYLPFIDPDVADQSNPPGPDGTPPSTFVDDLDDLDGWEYSPPRSAVPQLVNNKNLVTKEIPNMTGWKQRIDMTWLDPDDLSTAVADGASDVVQVTVTIYTQGEKVFTNSWLIINNTTE